ncbi:MAG: radical SAM family heme chaperone HemW [Salinivirgaceae bacterium]|nr:radical SAM family heme chaperone HemW [Salinivirgaceae bacterium]
MSGIYIHIPFCRQRCHYCDFYSTTQIKRKPELILALLSELEQRKDWIGEETIRTIYFGGGTPSLLSIDEINQILDSIYLNYNVVENPEITFEANPDDLTEKQLRLLSETRINRLSIGIQSFFNDDLQLMNRRHDREQAINSVKMAQEFGFKNISVDLIFGLPNLSIERWNENLKIVESLNVQHLSAYHLTYEKGTVFEIKRKKGEITPIMEEASIMQFKTLIAWAKQNNFIQYEISNFGKESFFSQHNSNYWNQKKYLGIGPSAHSYNIDTRLWNPSNLSMYINGIMKKQAVYEKEILSESDKYNELLITALRTKRGLNLAQVEAQFGNRVKHHLLHNSQKFVESKKLYLKDNALVLSDEGVFVSDAIMAELMLVEEEID